jgi:putative NADH-flavin reductase
MPDGQSVEQVQMKVAVLGANGKTGRLAVEEALRRGHQVVAVVRDPDQVATKDERLTVAQADAFDESSLVVVAS